MVRIVVFRVNANKLVKLFNFMPCVSVNKCKNTRSSRSATTSKQNCLVKFFD